MMADMGMTMDMPWSAVDVFFTFAMWAVMMVGMMAPSASPVVLLFAGMHRRRSRHGAPAVVLAFGAGYLLVWTAFSAGAALAQWALHQAAMLSPAMSASSPRLAGAILIGAGTYQLTPFKGACLTQCRSPLGFLMSNWRDGKMGALRMGFRHGGYCLGCCWALMLVMFAAGVADLRWMAALTALMAYEKIGRHGPAVATATGVRAQAVAPLVAAQPTWVPW